LTARAVADRQRPADLRAADRRSAGRETIRTLSALDLERAAGGLTLSEQTICFRCAPTHPCDPQ
jgi:hypothetical protein